MKKRMLASMLTFMMLFSSAVVPVHAAADQQTIAAVQEALNTAGYDCGTPDGIAGSKTTAAISDYQEKQGLTVSGEIDYELLEALGLAASRSEPERSETIEAGGQELLGIVYGVAEDFVMSEEVFTSVAQNNNFSLSEADPEECHYGSPEAVLTALDTGNFDSYDLYIYSSEDDAIEGFQSLSIYNLNTDFFEKALSEDKKTMGQIMASPSGSSYIEFVLSGKYVINASNVILEGGADRIPKILEEMGLGR